MQSSFKAVVFASLLFVAGCDNQHSEKTEQAAVAPKPVQTAVVLSRPSAASTEYVGTVISRNRAVIQSRIQAWVTQIPVGLGSRVKKGELLIELDNRDLEAQVLQAQTSYKLVSTELKRYDDLLAKQMVSQREYDGVKTEVDAANAALTAAQTALSYAKIEAPFDGTITQRSIDTGDMAQPGIALLTIEQDAPLLFSAMLPESMLRQLKPGDSVSVYLHTLDTTITAPIAELPSGADPTNHTFEIRLRMPLQRNINSGIIGRLQIADPQEYSLWIPRSALIKRGQLDLVYAVSDKQSAVLRLIRIGRETPEQIEILAGLQEGERIVVDGQALLFDGDMVEEAP